MTGSDAVARAEELLGVGLTGSAFNVLADDARGAGWAALKAGGADGAADAQVRRAALLQALDATLALLRESRDALARATTPGSAP